MSANQSPGAMRRVLAIETGVSRIDNPWTFDVGSEIVTISQEAPHTSQVPLGSWQPSVSSLPSSPVSPCCGSAYALNEPMLPFSSEPPGCLLSSQRRIPMRSKKLRDGRAASGQYPT